MPKRCAQDAMQAVTVPSWAEAAPGMKSRSGRVVKPKVWDDGTLAAPLVVMREEPPEHQDHRSEADPDYSHDVSEERGLSAHEEEGSEEEGYSEDGPVGSRGSMEGSRGSGGLRRSGSAGRDEQGKFTSGSRGRNNSIRHGRIGRGEGGGIFKMAAVEVLRYEKRLMSTGEIARMALKRGLIKCTGKTPEATMASALYTDIKRKEGQSIFIRPHEGLFGLREWIDQGVLFQDEYAEEMAKRARAAFGPFMPGLAHPMMPGPMDVERGMPIPMMPYPGGMPMPAMMPMMAGMGPMPGALGVVGKKAGAATEEEAQDGLMELLCAAEELHRSASKEREEREGEDQGTPGHGADSAAAPDAAPDGQAAAAGPSGEEGTPAEAGQRGEGSGGEDPGSSEGAEDAAAMLAAVAAAAAGPGPLEQMREHAMQGGYMGGMPPEAGMAYPAFYPGYPYYYPPFYPGAMKNEQTETAGDGRLELVVRGSNKPLSAAAAAGVSRPPLAPITGQEQINILNLPLPEATESGAMQDQENEEDPIPAPGASVTAEQLRSAEVHVMRLERELGTSHPEVGKAYLSLSRLYLAGVIESSAKQLAVAALSRAHEIMSVCQMALKRQPACASSFTYLADKIRSGGTPRPLGQQVANGEAAHVALPTPGGVAAH